jgi:glucose/arabinose dehydrogenase
MRRAVVVLLAGLCLLGLAGGAGAVSPPSGFLDTTAVNGLTKPTSMVWDASSARLFVTQQEGDLRVVEGGKLLGTPFVHLNVDPNGERGLLGVELDPNFASNHFLYLYYTVPGSPPHNRVSRFTAQGNVAAPGSEQVLLDLNDLSSMTNHNGGALHFGADGKLYIAVGDNANGTNSQTLTGGNLLGKILRMSSDGSIPADNPFSNSLIGNSQLIWSYGLRNPFTFGVQPGTGRIFLNDVGQSTYEEIDDGTPGANYGWPTAEGPANPPNASFTDPLFCYRHALANPACTSTTLTGCAITGGTFYNPPVTSFPAQYVGRYFFSDLCSGWISQLDPGSGNAVSGFATAATSPVDLDTGPDGALYYLEDGTRIGRISFKAPPTVTTFAPSSGAVDAAVTVQGTYLAGATSVTFNGTPATFTVVLDSRLVATVPAGATSGQIMVTTGSGSATSAGSFTVSGGGPSGPAISSFTPTGGPPGTSVTINGSGFTGATAVAFNGTAASRFRVNSPTRITAVVAPGTTSGPISVTTPAGNGTSVGVFNVPPPPTITTFSPTQGQSGTSVTINGSNFSGATAVKFNGFKAKSFVVQSNSTISAVVAKGAKSGPLSVTTPAGTATSSTSFTVLP